MSAAPSPVVWSGILLKMGAEDGDPVRYRLRDGTLAAGDRAPEQPLTPHVGAEVRLRFLGEIRCTLCGRATRTTFGDGYCFPCSQSRAEGDLCIVRPELCHHGDPGHPCRDEEFARTQCFQPHVLYVSLTSGLKVGITRQVNVPSRWLDQGAVAAVPVARLPDRRTVGLLEKRLSDAGHADRTHWSRLLKEDPPVDALAPYADQVARELESWGVAALPPRERELRRFRYPVAAWPRKVSSLSLDKNPEVGGVLQGIKGQYLLFPDGVLNVRKHAGYRVEFRIEDH